MTLLNICLEYLLNIFEFFFVVCGQEFFHKNDQVLLADSYLK